MRRWLFHLAEILYSAQEEDAIRTPAEKGSLLLFLLQSRNLGNTRTVAVKLFGRNKRDVALIKVMDVNIYSDSVGIRVAEDEGQRRQMIPSQQDESQLLKVKSLNVQCKDQTAEKGFNRLYPKHILLSVNQLPRTNPFPHVDNFLYLRTGGQLIPQIVAPTLL